MLNLILLFVFPWFSSVEKKSKKRCKPPCEPARRPCCKKREHYKDGEQYHIINKPLRKLSNIVFWGNRYLVFFTESTKNDKFLKLKNGF